MLEAEADNFAVTFDLWSQVIDKLSGPENLKVSSSVIPIIDDFS